MYKTNRDSKDLEPLYQFPFLPEAAPRVLNPAWFKPKRGDNLTPTPQNTICASLVKCQTIRNQTTALVEPT